jgi:hypothetical protein
MGGGLQPGLSGDSRGVILGLLFMATVFLLGYILGRSDIDDGPPYYS